MDKKWRGFATGVGKRLQVTFVAYDDGLYEMQLNGAKQDFLAFNKDKHQVNGKPMKKKDYFLVEFALDDQTTEGNLRVPPNPMEGFWVCTPRQMDPPSCPEEPSYDDEIFAILADSDKGTLTIRNDDLSTYEFQFTLRFLPEGADPTVSSNYVPYDPIGQNENGGVSSFE